MSTIKQRRRAVARAVKRLDQAAEALSELMSIAAEFGVDSDLEERFSDDLRERANYWELARWWQKEAP